VIIKKKLNQFPFINLLKLIFLRLILITGTLTLLLITLLIFYYLNSGMYERYKPLSALKKIDQVVVSKYLGFSFLKIDDYLQKKFKSLKFIIFKNDLSNVTIKIDQKNLYNLELQRKNKVNGLSEKVEKFSEASLVFNDNEYDIKLRVKGDRVLHWYDKDQTSYKIDLRGDDRIWGLEEFSVQKPITRNYIYEYIFHKFLEFNDLISLKYFFINLSLNDTKQGIYAVEEGFSKELIERNKKRYGPIFGLEESEGSIYPDIEYDLYSKNFWQSNHSELIESASLKLKKFKNKQINLEKIFDLDKWATYFAAIDLTANFHGSIPKSVKFYYNPISAKFEPIGFDGHYNPNLFQNFMILDFMDINNKNCSYICKDREWYLRFLNNEKFISIYKKKLQDVSSEILINKFYESNLKMIEFYNNQFLSETSKEDKVLYKGLGPYLYDDNYLVKRSQYIKKRLSKINNQSKLKNLPDNNEFTSKNLLNEKEIYNQGGNYFLKTDLEINENLYLAKNKVLNIKEGVKINFKKDVSILSEGSIFFNGTQEEPIIIYSDNKIGSLILSNNNFEFSNVIFKNLSYPKIKEKILYGGVNIINSNLKIKNTKIISSNSEDAINIINSNSLIDNLEVKNISADAIDIDYGKLEFTNINCENILNDCLDVSAAEVKGNFLKGNHIKDKGLSFGENSTGVITNVDFQNSKLGIAVKDGSKLKLSTYLLKDNEYDVAVFNKKKEYKEASLQIYNSIENIELNYLIGTNNEITKDQVILTEKTDNNIINELFY
jgi:hypothetical protein